MDAPRPLPDERFGPAAGCGCLLAVLFTVAVWVGVFVWLVTR